MGMMSCVKCKSVSRFYGDTIVYKIVRHELSKSKQNCRRPKKKRKIYRTSSTLHSLVKLQVKNLGEDER